MAYPVRSMLAGATALMAATALSPTPAEALPAGSPQAQFATDVKVGFEVVGSLAGACGLFPGCVSGYNLLFGPPNASPTDFFKIAAITSIVVSAADALIADPIDFNYTTVAQPAPITVPSIDPSFLSTATDMLEIGSLLGALDTAFERAEGALASGAPSFEQLQINAFNTFQGDLATDLSSLDATFTDNFGIDFGSFGQLSTEANSLPPITSATVAAGVSSPTPVPEPNSAALLFLACLLFAGLTVSRKMPLQPR